jgi:hypothetical protein
MLKKMKRLMLPSYMEEPNRKSKFYRSQRRYSLMDGDYGNAELRPMARGVLKYFYTII